jgi:hypothetical protein
VPGGLSSEIFDAILPNCVLVIALAGGMAGELDVPRQRSSDHEGLNPSAGDHRDRTSIQGREVGAGNGNRSRRGADRSLFGRPQTESEPIGDRRDTLITRVPSSGQIDRQTNRGRVSLPQSWPCFPPAALFPSQSCEGQRFHNVAIQMH